MNESLFRKEALEARRYLPHGTVLLRQPFSYRVLSVCAAVAVAGVMAILAFGSASKRESVTGLLAPTRGLVQVPVDLNGRMEEIRVKEGDLVRKGDVLAIVRQLRFTDSRNVTDRLREADRSDEAYIQDRIDGERALAVLERKRLAERRLMQEMEVTRLKDRLEHAGERVRVAESKFNLYRQMQQQGLVVELRLDEERVAWQDTVQAQRALQAELDHKRAALRDLDIEEQEAARKSSASVSEVARRRLDSQRQRIERESRETSTVVAPVDGRVTSVRYFSGQSAATGDTLLSLVPNGAVLEAQLFVPSRAIGHIQIGQQVNLRYQAFPYQQYGIFTGRVREISEGTIAFRDTPFPSRVPDEPLHVVRVDLDDMPNQGGPAEVRLQTGMLLDADLLMRAQPLWRLLLGPLLQVRRHL